MTVSYYSITYVMNENSVHLPLPADPHNTLPFVFIISILVTEHNEHLLILHLHVTRFRAHFEDV